jgi:alpha/beta hydrolase fold
VLINLHGGGFLEGSRSVSHMESIPITAVAKIKVISVDYRQAPEYRFPAATQDVVAVYRQLLKNEFKVKRGRENEVIALLRQLLPESKKHAKDVIESGGRTMAIRLDLKICSKSRSPSVSSTNLTFINGRQNSNLHDFRGAAPLISPDDWLAVSQSLGMR